MAAEVAVLPVFLFCGLATYFLCTKKRATVGAGKEGGFTESSGLGNIEILDFSSLWPYNST